MVVLSICCFVKQKTAYEVRISDWSSDVCSSDLWRLLRLPSEAKRDALDLFTRSAREVLDGFFESDAIKAVFGFDAVVGNYASPDTPGSAYVLLHHVFGEVNGKAEIGRAHV